MITVGCDLASSNLAIEVARAFDDVWATAGVHPHDATEGIEGIAELLGDPKVVAVGECGLDYFYEHAPKAEQRRTFAAQIALAHESGLALVIHAREAWDDLFEVLVAEGVPTETVLHCFTGGPAEAERCVDLGLTVSISGIVTFKNAQEVRDAVARIPLDRLLVETDAPFLAPVPHRGATNEPAWVSVVGEAVAGTLGLPAVDVAAATSANARRIFRIG